MSLLVGTRRSLLGGGGLIVRAWDAFTDVDGTALESHAASDGGSWTKSNGSGAGSMTIDSGRIHNTNDTNLHVYRHSWVPQSPDYDVECEVYIASDNNLCSAGPSGRIASGANTNYLFRYNTNGNKWQLFKYVAGVATQVGSDVSQAITGTSAVARLSFRGSRIICSVDGIPVIDQIDTGVTAAGFAGVWTTQAATSSVGAHLDNWRALQ